MDTSNEQTDSEQQDDTAVDETSSEAQGSSRPKKQRSGRGKGSKSGSGEEPGPMALALRRFQACGRCSYFVADCQIYFGRDTVRTAIEEGPAEWLTLEWAEVLRRLTRESYIADDNVFYFYYDGTCPECRRRYTYITEPLEDEQPLFRLHY